MTEPTQAEIDARREELAKKPCACYGAPLAPTVEKKMVSRLVMAHGDAKPMIEDLHERCYLYVKKHVEENVERERARKVG